MGKPRRGNRQQERYSATFIFNPIFVIRVYKYLKDGPANPSEIKLHRDRFVIMRISSVHVIGRLICTCSLVL